MSEFPSFDDQSPNQGAEIHIPELLWSFETGEPFHRCLICNGDLIRNRTLYFINKCFREDETVFEIAVCLPCHQGLRSELSESSLSRIQNYLDEFRVEEMMTPDHAQSSFEAQIQNCLIKKRPPNPREEKQIIAYCIGSNLVSHIPAMMLSWEAIQDMENLLSKATRDTMDDFTETYLGPTTGSKRPKWVPV